MPACRALPATVTGVLRTPCSNAQTCRRCGGRRAAGGAPKGSSMHAAEDHVEGGSGLRRAMLVGGGHARGRREQARHGRRRVRVGGRSSRTCAARSGCGAGLYRLLRVLHLYHGSERTALRARVPQLLSACRRPRTAPDPSPYYRNGFREDDLGRAGGAGVRERGPSARTEPLVLVTQREAHRSVRGLCGGPGRSPLRRQVTDSGTFQQAAPSFRAGL
ncbi:hypothetical protein FKP32DRAFT_1007460 [Trametes sanguinea]|nr:hypothetical protein FKP32DRAFT_1007460 [Trametes sanguinea]